MQLKRVEEAIEAVKNGEMIIIMDDEGRENEGDIVYAASFSTPSKMNFLLKEARGIVCAPVSREIATRLDLPLMVSNNSSHHNTAFTVSIDAKSARTGVSSYERDLTIKLLASDLSKAQDFARPGHIFPLIAKDGGVLVRTGHTEASIDICRLAGLKEVAVICELMKEDGSMASNNDNFVAQFASKHNLKILYVSDLVYYRLNYEQLVHLASRSSSTFFGAKVEKYIFNDHFGNTHIGYEFKGGSSPNFVRLHVFNSTSHLLLSDSLEVLMRSIEFLKENGGFLICLQDAQYSEKESKEESEKESQQNKSKEDAEDDAELNNVDYHLELKSFGIGAQILRLLGVEEFKLLTTTIKRQYPALSGFTLTIVESVEL